MRDFDAEFREFSAAFAEPLTRLGYLLLATGDSQRDQGEASARQRTLQALARVRRRWRDATSGSPESLAIESLLTRLPRTAAEPEVAASSVRFPENEEDEDDALLDAAWRAWTTLAPRERVPLVFADVGVASRQLQGVGLPDSFGSARGLRRLDQTAWLKFRGRLLSDVVATNAVRKHPPEHVDQHVGVLLSRALTQKAATIEASVDAYPQAIALASRGRRRLSILVASATAVVIAVTAISVSTSRHSPKASAAAATASAHPSAPPPSAFVANSDERVVDWPTRGELRGDTTLLSSLRSTFVADHTDAIGDVQVLLATDTSSFRLAYLTAHSPQGVIDAWYFGPVGSTKLTEGSFTYAGNLQHSSVVAAALSDPAGHSVLVVIGPPETSQVLLSQVNAANYYDASFNPISEDDGIVVRDVSKQYLPSLFVKLFEGQQLGWNRPVPVIQLGQLIPDLPPVTVERGNPNPTVLARALQTEADWARTGELSAGGQAVVLWGGGDGAGEQLVVLRVKTLHLADLLIVAWSDGDGEYLLPPDLPDYPIGFAYPTKTGARVAVLTAPGVAKAELVEDGVVTGSQPVDATGFASLEVNRPYPALAQRSFAVRLYDGAGHQVSELAVPPQV